MQKLNELYDELAKVDDIAIKAVELSLPKHAVEVIERIRLDYAQDIGIIGLLRRTHIEAGFDEALQLFWRSRREPTSPRLESVLSQMLLNIAASAIFEVLKDIGRDPEQIKGFMSARAIAASVWQAGGLDMVLAWDQLCRVWQLYILKKAGKVEPVQAAITETLNGCAIRIEIEGETVSEVETLRQNLLYAVRGLVIQEIERSGEIVLPANGHEIVGVPASSGLGFGPPALWPAARRLNPAGEFILAVPSIGGQLPEALTKLLSACQAAVSTDIGLTGHVSVYCRSIGKPLVLVTDTQMNCILAHNFIVVDGTAGRIKLFLDRASSRV